jgi:hypothetical protein
MLKKGTGKGGANRLSVRFGRKSGQKRGHIYTKNALFWTKKVL